MNVRVEQTDRTSRAQASWPHRANPSWPDRAKPSWPSRAMRALLMGALLVCGGVLFTSPAHAAPHVDVVTAKELIAALDVQMKKKDFEQAADQIDELATAYEGLTDKAARRRVMKRVGKCARCKHEAVVQAALEAFDEMGDGAAWKYLASFLRQPDRRVMPQHFEQALRTIKSLKPEGAIQPLLTMARKSKHLGVASAAMETLAVYRESSKRKVILKTIIEVVRKEQPGVKGRSDPAIFGPRQTGQEARNRWEALARPMVETANALTGQMANSPSSWFELYNRHKRNLDDLFQEM